MCATADRRAHPLFRLAAGAALVLMMIGLADRPLVYAHDAGMASKASCDAGHSDCDSPHPDHADESDIPVVEAVGGLGRPRRLCPPCLESGTSVPQRPPARPPSF